MSDLSEEFVESATNRVGLIHENDQQKKEFFNSLESRVPWARAFTEHLTTTMEALVRAVWFKWNGITPISVDAYINDISDSVLDEVLPRIWDYYASGIVVGRGNSEVVKANEMPGLLNNKDFEFEADLLSSTLRDDEDLTDEIVALYQKCFTTVRDVSCIEQAPVEFYPKVWDLFIMTANAAAAGAFWVGYEIGQKKQTIDTLNGIWDVSE